MPPVLTACTRHCTNGCSLLVESGPDGRVTIRGNPEHPYTAGLICAKTARFLERIGSPERILTPMIRDAKPGSLRPASWDEALERVCERIAALRARPEEMLHIFYHASFGALFSASRHLFALLGASAMTGSMCQGAGIKGLSAVFGDVADPDYLDIPLARSIVNWGRNLDAQTPHVGRLVNQARANGAHVLTLTPDAHGFAPYADRIIILRPGADRFVAAVAARLLLDQGLLPAAALARAANADAWLALLRGLDVSAACAAAGISLEEARAVAGAYAAGPTVSLLGRGLQRYAFGGENAAFVAALAAGTGNVGRTGGGLYFATRDRGGMGSAFPPAPGPAPRTFRFADPGGDLRRAREAGRPVRLVWTEGTNIVTQAQDSLAIRDELMRAFTVVVEPFPTDTTDCADVVLPPALMLECEDVAKSSNHEWLHHAAQVLAPRGQARSNFDIARAVALRLGLPFPEAGEAMAAALRGSRGTTSLTELRAAGCVRGPAPGVPFADGVYAHPDGLCRLPEALHADAPRPDDRPLRLLSMVQKRYLLSQIPLSEQEGPADAFVAPKTLARLGFAPGDAARLLGERGEMTVRLQSRAELAPDCVHLPRGGWLKCGRCANSLAAGRETDIGGQAAYYEQWCRIERPTAHGER